MPPSHHRARTSVLIADGQPVFRDGLARTIKERPDLELVAIAGDGRHTLDEIVRLRPDVAMIDVELDRLDGMQVLTAVVRDGLPTRVMFLTALLESDAIYEALGAGATAYLSKAADRDEICDAIAAVMRGEAVLSPAAQVSVAGEIRERAGENPGILTARERGVIELVARGRTVAQVAEELSLSRATVKTHLQHLYDKLGVSSQAAAVAEAMRRDLIE